MTVVLLRKGLVGLREKQWGLDGLRFFNRRQVSASLKTCRNLIWLLQTADMCVQVRSTQATLLRRVSASDVPATPAEVNIGQA